MLVLEVVKPEKAYAAAAWALAVYGRVFNRPNWQATQALDDMLEVMHVVLEVRAPTTIEEAQAAFQPELPWAEEHFQERVSGEPLNPGTAYLKWPRYLNQPPELREKFLEVESRMHSHTYMERFWPKSLLPRGIRYPTGDLADVVDLLKRDPTTRRAYLPVWFPEDTGALEYRVPCSLGYLFMSPDGVTLDVEYYIRSVDLIRHFRNDLYMAARLLQWVGERAEFKPGKVVMVMGNLHAWAKERRVVERIASGWQELRLFNRSFTGLREGS
jgi:hypothetical protein